ncbi:MAG: orotate phosphoribosyltransferase [Bacteroidales bacterium]|nr:orotate phosphoribosyltransferase [Bacteroidales bacterium]
MDDKAKKIADYLLQIKAIKLQPSTPFTWASGLKSPIYCDNRKTLSYPEVRNFIRDMFGEKVRQLYPETEIIAGVATGAIAHGMLVADLLGLPFIYIRSGAKEHGLGNQIEGDFKKGDKVIVIEDLVSTGGSSLSAVNALREAGCDVLGMLAIFTYGFEKAKNAFSSARCDLQTLSNYDALVNRATETGYISGNELITLKEWRINPSVWGV